MRHLHLALLVSLALSPAAAFADAATGSCAVVDDTALAALNLAGGKKKQEFKNVPATKSVPQQRIDTCVMSPPYAPLPALSVTSVALPPGTKAVKLSCTDQTLPTVKLSICNATAKGTLMSVSLVTPLSADAQMQQTLRTQLDRLIKGMESGAK